MNINEQKLVKKRIHVTVKDIDGGVCGDANKCAVSRAMIRQLPGMVTYRDGQYFDEKADDWKQGKVTDFGVYSDKYSYDGLRFRERQSYPNALAPHVQVPKRVQDWIDTFDRGDKTKVGRISFTVTVPESYLVPRAGK